MKMIVFDVFNTLIYESKERSIVEIGSELFGIDFSLLEHSYKCMGIATMCGLLSTMEDRLFCAILQNRNIDYHTFCNALSEFKHQYEPKLEIYDDVVDSIRQLSSHKLYLFTNISNYSIDKLESIPFFEHIERAYYSCREGVMKPNKDFYNLLPTDDVVYYVGDGEHDELKSAKEVGFETILVDRRLPHTNNAKKNADHVVCNIAEILGIVNG